MWHWIETHGDVLSLVMAGSFLILLGTLALIPFMIAGLPDSYFEDSRRRPLEHLLHRPTLRITLLLLKNALGLILLLAGLAMLVIPGQGLLTLFVAMILIDFRGKFALKCKLIRLPRLRRLMNRFRIRHGKAPFIIPDS